MFARAPRPWVLALIAGAVLAGALTGHPVQADAPTQEDGGLSAPREAAGLIVKYQPGTSAQEAPGVPTGADEVTVTDIELGTRIGFGLRTVEFPDTESALVAEVAAKQLEQDPTVVWAEPNWVINVESQPAGRVSPRTLQSGATWGIDRIDQRSGLSGTYRYQTTGLGVTAYIIDTGILSTHTEFAGRVASGYSTVSGSSSTEDCNGHGTHVAGTVGGTTYGVAKQVTLVPVRVLNCAGSGNAGTVIYGIYWAIQDHDPGEPAVINMSLGGGAYAPIDNAVAAAVADGITVVVAAGNDTDDACLSSPARAPDAITVNASTSADTAAWFSNFGACSDLYAPGQSITSAWYTSTTATNTISGTSMASPHVAGASARILQAHPTWTPAEVWAAMSAATTPIDFGPGGSDPNKLLYVDPLDGARPSVPTGLTITPGYDSLAVAWTAPVDGLTPTQYDVQHSDDTGATWTSDDSTAATSTTLTALNPAKSYLVRVRSATADDSSAWVTSASSQPLAPTVPGAVISLNVLADDDTTLHLTWNAPASTGGRPIDHYVISHSDDGVVWVADDTTTALTTTITGLADDSTYLVRVSAVNAIGQGPPTMSTAVRPRVITIPAAPQGLGAVAGDASLALSWSTPLDSGGRPITSYVVQTSTDDSTWTPQGSTASTSLTVTGLVNGQRYSVRVAAVSSQGTGAWATAVGTPVAPAPPPAGGGGGGAGGGGGGGAAPAPAPSSSAKPPAAPTITSATADDARISLTWLPSDDTGGAAVTGYSIEVAGPDGTQTLTSTSTHVDIDPLTNGATYRARVAAVNSAGAGAWSAWTAELTPQGLPSAPLNLVATPGDGSARLEWSTPLTTGGAPITGYIVSVEHGGRTQQLSVTDTSTALVGLVNDESYSVTVAAVTASGQGEPTSPVTFTPKAVHVTAPTHVRVTWKGNRVVVTWAIPDSGKAIGYVVYASVNGKPERVATQTRALRGSFDVRARTKSLAVTVAAIDAQGPGPHSTPIQLRAR